MKKLITFLILLATLTACKNNKGTEGGAADSAQLVGPTFCADSAFKYCDVQCSFGPRTMNSEAHDKCEAWIIEKFKQFGATVTTQKADLEGWDGKKLHSTNIIASINPDATRRVIICAHWDCRPWADNDPDSTNWKKPVLAANDAASGVGVMLELCRIINAADSTHKLEVGVDFVCFDAEDYGAPDWSGLEDAENTWALGAQYFANKYMETGVTSAYGKAAEVTGGILLDMVGGQGAKFCREQLSEHYAKSIVDDVWRAAYDAGFSAFFVNDKGGAITDDHKPLNEVGLPTIDIIPYYADCEASVFGPTWHTVNDDMQHLDKNVLGAVGQTLVQYLYTRKF